MRRNVTLAAAALVAALALTACDAAEDAARDAAGDAACSVARSAVDEAGTQASQAADQINADPAAAEQRLSAVRDTLAAAESGLSGDAKATLVEAKSAVEELLGQAQDAVQGAEVDTTVLDSAKGDLDRAVTDVKNLC